MDKYDIPCKIIYNWQDPLFGGNMPEPKEKYLGELKESCNPVMYCEGGLYGGHLKPNEKICPVIISICSTRLGEKLKTKPIGMLLKLL